MALTTAVGCASQLFAEQKVRRLQQAFHNDTKGAREIDALVSAVEQS